MNPHPRRTRVAPPDCGASIRPIKIARNPIPSPDTLIATMAPELALLTALDYMLDAACSAVIASNPELLLDTKSYFDAELDALATIWSAEEIIACAKALGTAIARYRHATFVTSTASRDSDIPF